MWDSLVRPGPARLAGHYECGWWRTEMFLADGQAA